MTVQILTIDASDDFNELPLCGNIPYN